MYKSGGAGIQQLQSYVHKAHFERKFIIEGSELLNILDNVLESTFGHKMKNLLYDYLLKSYSISKSQILQNTPLFLETLVSIFGESGAKLIEYEILRAIETKIPRDMDEIRLTLSQIHEYASTLRNCINFLSEYEAKLYIALISCGESPAQKIAKITDIPRQKIYHAAKKLKIKGMIVSRKFQGVTWFKPMNPEKIFKDQIDLMSKKLMMFKQIVKEIGEVYQALSLPEELDSLEQLNPVKSSSKGLQ